MPVSPAMAEDLAAAIRTLYDDAELTLIDKLRQALADGLESPLWAEIKLRSIGDLRQAVEEVTQALQTDADGAVAEALATAYGRGRQAAVAELGALDIGRELQARAQLPNAPAVDRLAASWAADTRPLYARITRAVLDFFRDIVTRVSTGTLLGTMTRRQASQEALNRFARRGVTGFTDKAGRNWELGAYAEMAVRSVTARAAVEGHIDALAEIGVGLVIVSDAPLECPLCAPWEGEVLSLGAESGPRSLRVEHAIQPKRLFAATQTVVVHVAGSLIEARAAGLFHPNCRHALSAYLPGVTTRPKTPPHPQGATYEDTQRQRYYERQVRAWKRRAAAGMDEGARRTANAKVRAYQARIRALTDEKGLARKRPREQIGAAR
ncbi:phage minor capsid protein [Streptomyces sp. UC4497]